MRALRVAQPRLDEISDVGGGVRQTEESDLRVTKFVRHAACVDSALAKSVLGANGGDVESVPVVGSVDSERRERVKGELRRFVQLVQYICFGLNHNPSPSLTHSTTVALQCSNAVPDIHQAPRYIRRYMHAHYRIVIV